MIAWTRLKVTLYLHLLSCYGFFLFPRVSTNWIGHILRRNCLLKQVIEGKIKGEMEVTRRRKKLLDDLKDRRGYSHLKEEALDRNMWRNCFWRGFGPFVRYNTEWLNEWILYLSFRAIIYNKPTRCNSGRIVFINNCRYAVHVSDALRVYHQELHKL